MKLNAVQKLIKQVGVEEAQFLLGVHSYTLYKWNITDDKNPSKRTPSAATLMLAGLFLFLLNDWNWELDDLSEMVKQINNTNR